MACGGCKDTQALFQELLVRLQKVQGTVDAILEHIEDPEADNGMEETSEEDLGSEVGDEEPEYEDRPAKALPVGAPTRLGWRR